MESLAHSLRSSAIWRLWLAAIAAIAAIALNLASHEAAAATKRPPLALVVMDPLAKELACTCLRGYAQRDYHQLASYLSKELKQRVVVSFSEDLADSIGKLDPGQEALVIAKHSVVEHDAAAVHWKQVPLASLTGLDGATTAQGLFVVKTADSANKLEDLRDRRFLFGSPNAAECHAAALAAVKSAGLAPPSSPETRESNSDVALDVLDSTAQPGPVGVISSYSLRLLEGCGSLKKGDLKVIGRTAEVPFITAFVSASMPTEQRELLQKALLGLAGKPKLCKALETQKGFVPLADKPTAATTRHPDGWADWRGPGRDGHVPRLPARLPATTKVLWTKPALNGGLAGLAVGENRVLVADRDPTDSRDVFRCLQADTGETLWIFHYEAAGKLDYGQFPRATPVIRGDHAYLLGAFGDLHCVGLKDGKALWHRHLVRDLGGRLPKWGASATPLLIDDKLIVNAGGPQASLVALDQRTGETRWKTAGNPAAYAAFILATLGGKRQIVGYDQTTLGGWDPVTGERLWCITPEFEGDFNVPTPLVVAGQLVVATENNGTRAYAFAAGGKAQSTPAAQYADLTPDTSSPVAVGGRVFGVFNGLHCLDATAHLQCLWKLEDKAFDEHASLFADDERLLIVALNGECLLVDARADQPQVLSRLRLFADDAEVYSHPALVGNRLYVRGTASVSCFDLGTE